MRVKIEFLTLFLIFPAIYANGLVGGPSDITDEDVYSSDFAPVLSAIEDRLKSDIASQFQTNQHVYLLRVISGTKQIVAGVNYNLKIMMCESTCNEKISYLHDCFYNITTLYNYQVTIWVQEWLKSYQVTVSTLLDFQIIEKDDDDNLLGRFKDFKLKYNILYDTDDDENKRFKIFSENMAKAKILELTDTGTAKYGMNILSDLTEKEFMQRYTGKIWNVEDVKSERLETADMYKLDAPLAYDWREKGAVTKVKNQGNCGSCWAFSATGNIEGQWQIHYKTLFSLSEQQLMDCDHVDHACEGGLPSNAYKQIIKMGGLETNKDYPYVGFKRAGCELDLAKIVVKIKGQISISSDEVMMVETLYKNGPISIGINAAAMQFYIGGIADPFKFLCNPNHLDHGVLIVAYGEELKKPFWVIKNSWGPDWGEHGYYKVIRNKGVCGLNKVPTSAIV